MRYWVCFHIDHASGFHHDDFAGEHRDKELGGLTLEQMYPNAHFRAPVWCGWLLDAAWWLRLRAGRLAYSMRRRSSRKVR